MSDIELPVNNQGEPVFHRTNYTHEIVVQGERRALAESLPEAMIVARAISRTLSAHVETRIYAAFATLPHSSYRTGWEVK